MYNMLQGRGCAPVRFHQFDQWPAFGQWGRSMKRQLTLREYRAIDLLLFALMFAVFEFIIVRVANGSLFRDQAFTVSLAAAITSIVYMRWGLWGGVHAALTGFLFCFYSGGAPRQYVIYTVGNLFSLPMALVLKKAGHERVRESDWGSMLFPLGVILLMQGGRAAAALCLGAAPGGALGFFTTDSLSVLFTLVIVWIARRLDGIYEEQTHYLLRLQEKEKRNNQTR